jgi:hypothetical protein
VGLVSWICLFQSLIYVILIQCNTQKIQLWALILT